MNQNLLILGSRRLGAAAQEIAENMNCFAEINCLSIQEEALSAASFHTSNLLSRLSALSTQYHYGIAAVKNAELRLRLLQELEGCCYTVPTLIHPFTSVSAFASLGKGCMIEPGAVIEGESRIGDGVIVRAGSIVCSYSLVGEGSYLGLRSVVKEGALITPGTEVAAGTIVSGIVGKIPTGVEAG